MRRAAEAIRFTVNGEARAVATDPERPLLEVLREDLHLTGTKYGCGESRCGACSVLVDGRRQTSCRVPVGTVAGKDVRTVEGLARGDQLHPVQEAFLEVGALQCGYCTAGMVVAAVALLDRRPRPTDAEIAAGMNRNLCRCGSYPQIVAAVRLAAEKMEASAHANR
jgi:aerobic carbon-monoxide dehydrogenase small subunit